MTGEVWKIGKVTITRVVEIEATGGMSRIIPDATREKLQDIKWLYPHFADEQGRMRGAIHALLVETPDKRIIVDTCVGNDKARGVPAWNNLQTSFIDDITQAGYAPDSIDNVLCTHLHIDHVGWNTMLRDGKWVPTFPNARYLMGDTEFKHWNGGAGAERDGQDIIMADSVLPVFDAGLVDLVGTDHQICPEIRLVSTPGHTPGHVSVKIESEGEQGLITGDFLHHPCQFAHPEWSSSPDTDPPQAIATRLNMYERLADQPVLVIGTHFATPTAGYLKKDGNTYRLDV
ncbi:MAG: MBL fold metallo-hydrolase [Chromatiales bacterium]|jgi:glyoxylase-like metal-dependent hydrolase (beta-lactamase superfamily II)|nr:MBL fold metallo-hydrolase [Chromatiales bacterium]